MNIKEVPQIIDTAVKYGVDVFAFARYCPTSEEKDTDITPEEYRELLAVCDAKFKAYEAAGCQTYFNKKTISGRCTNMKPERSKSRRAPRRA